MQEMTRTLIRDMTLKEKSALCSGADEWNTVSIQRLGIPSVLMTDGPHGLRKETGEPGDDLMVSKSYPSVCYPTASALACSWDTDLMTRLGETLGEECLANGVSILLGPGVNIKRSPLCGRNFEYFSEDPLLAGELAAAFISGVQSRGVGTSLKHFAANNQETARMTTDTIVDERTLREIYLTNFEIAVKKSRPWTVMCAYNKLSGIYCSENKELLTGILRKEWGFDGIVLSDWGAVNERDDGLLAGLDLEMPNGGPDSVRKIIKAVKNGKLRESTLDETAARILRLVFKAAENKKSDVSCSIPAHHGLARQIAGECMVLLKNDGVLPLKKTGSLAVIGGFAKAPRFQGGGSSQINPTFISIPLDELRKTAGGGVEITWCAGYPEDTGGEAAANRKPDEKLIAEAVDAAAKADAALLFAGLPFESEGVDRTHLRLPEDQTAMIGAVSRAAKKTVIVLMNGAPVEMPWAGSVHAILECCLAGQAAGGAIADILFGDINPSGKLAETFPVKLSDNPSYPNFPGSGNRVEYKEGIFAGYRYYEKKRVAPLFPFGYGLSYTTFSYTGIGLSASELGENETVTVRVEVKNSGERYGKEIVQLYVRDVSSTVPRPEKELKAFTKVSLEPGEETTVRFTLNRRAFAFWDSGLHDWRVESGEFELLAGGSSADTPLKAGVVIHAGENPKTDMPKAADKIRSVAVPKTMFTRNSTIGEVLSTRTGAWIFKILGKGAYSIDSLPAYVLGMPLRSIRMRMPAVNDAKLKLLTFLLNTASKFGRQKNGGS